MKSLVPWWKNARGEWFVVAQVALLIVLFFGPRALPGWQPWPDSIAAIGSILGGPLFLIGTGLLVAGIFRLGSNLSALPYPKDDASLVDSGPYGLVRHPMYSGGILMAFGWGLWIHGWLTLVYAIALLAFFDIKSRREEGWLRTRFAGYPSYQARVHRLLPFVY